MVASLLVLANYLTRGTLGGARKVVSRVDGQRSLEPANSAILATRPQHFFLPCLCSYHTTMGHILTVSDGFSCPG